MQLLFVYNANTGFMNQSLDWIHKVISPSTYSCSLCNLTHNAFGVKKDWCDFINQLNIETEVLHKNEFEAKYPLIKLNFPWIGCIEDSKKCKTIASDELINKFENNNQLLDFLKVELTNMKLR